jgi:hypothetical protein
MSRPSHTNTVSCLTSFAVGTGEFVASGSFDGSIAVWQLHAARDGTLVPQCEHRIIQVRDGERGARAAVRLSAACKGSRRR